MRETLTWPMFADASRDLARQVVADGYEPDLLLSVARGGLLLAGTMSYALGVKSVHVVNVEFYTGVDERLEMPVVLPPVPREVDLSGMRVLVVDDVADTGGTLEVVQRLCAGTVAACRTAVVYQKPSSTVACDYVWRTTDRWIDFPWSSEVALAGIRA